MAKLSEEELREVQNYLNEGKPLPEKYRFLLFEHKGKAELVWEGKTDKVCDEVVPFQLSEKFQKGAGSFTGDWTNKLIWGDNKLILSSLKNGPLRRDIEAQGGLKLIYIDPPFDVGADFSMDIECGEDKFTKKPNILEEVAYRDTWGRGTDSFISMIYDRLSLMQQLLSDEGCIYVHCDWRVNSYIRMALDEIFGRHNLVNELIWHYRTFQGQTHAYFPKKHDTLLLYRKGAKHTHNELFDSDIEDTIDYRRWNAYLDDNFCIRGSHMPIQDSRFRRYLDRWRMEHGRHPSADDIVFQVRGQPVDSVWDMKGLDPKSGEKVGYPTQKPEAFLERIILSSSNEDDLIGDFFCGSGTTPAVAEKLGRKWIAADLGKFAVHTTRKRMIGVQRQLKDEGRDYRAFEILNLGRYERSHYIGVNPNLREEEQQAQLRKKEADFLALILKAYQAESVSGFGCFQGKRSGRLVAIGPINLPISRLVVEEIILECRKQHITKVDLLGFEFEMGLFPNVLDDARSKGIDIAPKYIPADVFDKRAVDRNQVVFHDMFYIEAEPIIEDANLAVQLTNFAIYAPRENPYPVTALGNGKRVKSKTVIENGQLIRLSKDGDRKLLTEHWSDWIDYWAVDFNYDGSVFNSGWQSFRTRRNRSIELISAPQEIEKRARKIAIKVIDVFGNETVAVMEVTNV